LYTGQHDKIKEKDIKCAHHVCQHRQMEGRPLWWTVAVAVLTSALCVVVLLSFGRRWRSAGLSLCALVASVVAAAIWLGGGSVIQALTVPSTAPFSEPMGTPSWATFPPLADVVLTRDNRRVALIGLLTKALHTDYYNFVQTLKTYDSSQPKFAVMMHPEAEAQLGPSPPDLPTENSESVTAILFDVFDTLDNEELNRTISELESQNIPTLRKFKADFKTNALITRVQIIVSAWIAHCDKKYNTRLFERVELNLPRIAKTAVTAFWHVHKQHKKDACWCAFTIRNRIPQIELSDQEDYAEIHENLATEMLWSMKALCLMVVLALVHQHTTMYVCVDLNRGNDLIGLMKAMGWNAVDNPADDRWGRSRSSPHRESTQLPPPASPPTHILHDPDSATAVSQEGHLQPHHVVPVSPLVTEQHPTEVTVIDVTMYQRPMYILSLPPDKLPDVLTDRSTNSLHNRIESDMKRRKTVCIFVGISDADNVQTGAALFAQWMHHEATRESTYVLAEVTHTQRKYVASTIKTKNMVSTKQCAENVRTLLQLVLNVQPKLHKRLHLIQLGESLIATCTDLPCVFRVVAWVDLCNRLWYDSSFNESVVYIIADSESANVLEGALRTEYVPPLTMQAKLPLRR
jgi:hypothetical protein